MNEDVDGYRYVLLLHILHYHHFVKPSNDVKFNKKQPNSIFTNL